MLETCFLVGLLFPFLSFVLLSSPGACAVKLLLLCLLLAPSLSVSASEFRFLEGMLPLQRADGKGSSPLLELTPRPTCKAALTCVMQGHQTASSLSAWLLLSLSLSLSLSLTQCVFLPLSLSLPPLSFSRSTPLTQLLPQPASSAASGIHSKKHTLLGSAPRLRSH